MVPILYGLSCLAMLVIMLFLYGYSFHALWLARRYRPDLSRPNWPKAALILPCRGNEPNLEENLRRHFHHDYPDYHIVFTLAHENDPAVPIIRKLIATQTDRTATVVIAPTLPDCVEKVSNQIAAMESLDPAVEVIVSADSDGLARDRYWLRALVSGLDRCTLISGFRWYIPKGPSFVGCLHSAFDSALCLLQALGKTTWGGAMAFTQAAYQRLGYGAALRRAVTDDLVVLKCTHQAGERTAFTVGSMMISEPALRFMDFFRWAVRQSQTVRLVTPWLYLMGFVSANIFGVFFALTLALLLVPNPDLGRAIPAAALGVAVLYYVGRGYLNYRMARSFFPEHPDRTHSLRWVYYWATPLSDLLTPVIAYTALFSRTVRWRGINYRIKDGRVVRV